MIDENPWREARPPAADLGASETAMNDRASAPNPAAAPRAGLWVWVRCRLQSTPVRTFAIYPVVVIAFALVWQGGTLEVVPWGVPLLIWGYLQYRLAGSYRVRHGGGGPGLEVPPQRLVGDGLYRYTRNPMYLGHLIFMAGLALTFWSWLALVILIVNLFWFDRRVRGDEQRLLQRFGPAYAEYCGRVKRWIPGLI
jgi:protein-S-isoprenylcysteine O-methyltransferase Ste14